MALIAYFSILVVLVLVWRGIRGLKGNRHLPPGPRADPVLGHLRIMPRASQPEVYREWSRVYGDVMYINALGQHMVILSTEQAANDLLDKRSAIYSDRPLFHTHNLVGWGDMLVFLPYGEKFNRQRKLSQQPFTRQGSLMFRNIQVQQAHVMLHNLWETPQDFENHARRFSTAVITEIAYGHHVVSNDDPYVRLAEELNNIITGVGDPGTSPVDIFPILKHLPPWVPGAWFIQYGIEAKKKVKQMREFPFQEVQKQMAAGTAKVSFLSMHLEEYAREREQSEEELNDLKIAASHLYGAGGDTTYSTVVIFLFAMLLHPEVQRKAQEEIDSVVGQNRLPDFSDRESLPFVECVVRETLRWHPAAPLGVPHRSTADDEYRGMFIPKGSTIIANVRAMTLDEKVYADPFIFYPERYLPEPAGNGEPFPGANFGFGRRICPGRHLADASLWIVAATLLATFDIRCAKDENGNDIIPKPEFTEAITSHPKPFVCDIRSRCPKAEVIIRNAYSESIAS